MGYVGSGEKRACSLVLRRGSCGSPTKYRRGRFFLHYPSLYISISLARGRTEILDVATRGS